MVLAASDFSPDVPDPGETSSSGSSSNMLPNGNYDIYNLGSLYDKPVYLGNVNTVSEAPPSDYGPYGKVVRSTPMSVTTEDMAREFAGWSISDPQNYAALQQQLYNAGFYGSTRPRAPGIYTTQDRDAITKALASYTGVVNPNDPNPLTLADYLDRASQYGAAEQASESAASGGGGGGRAPLSLTDPAALKQTLQSAAQNALHRDLSEEELNHFVDAFHAKEQAAYNAAGGGATYTSPDPSADAVQAVDDAHKPEEQQALEAGYLDTLKSMLGVTPGGNN